MKSAIVMGAGWAGLSCSIRLAQAGYRVTVLEAGKRLGGRASSFHDSKTGDTVDNGQHLLMGCYTESLSFLKTIGTFNKLQFQKNLSVDFLDRQGKSYRLSCPSLPAPFHLFTGLLGLGTLSLAEKIGMARVYRAVKSWNGNGALRGVTVEDWLISLGQSQRCRKHFWDLITISALNERSAVAEADSLAIVLKEAFFVSREKSRIAMAGDGLSDLLDPACGNYLAAHGGKIQRDCLVTGLTVEGDGIRHITLRGGESLRADFYVSALPFFALKNMLGPGLAGTPFFSKINHLESSPIFSISLWFDRQVTDKKFCALLDTHVQWVFNKGNHLALVISGARACLGMPDPELLDLCVKEIHECFPLSRDARLLHHLIQREKNATLSPKKGHGEFRLPQKTPVKNFFLAGDWTDTGYPATIESAVLSGVKAFRAVHENS